MAAKKKAYFTRHTFDFLRELAINNNRPWFEENKERYEKHLKAPMLEFIRDFSGPLGKISKHYLADPRPNGGSMFRIYRDTRFAKDKIPYKTQVSAHFRHVRAKDVHSPGFYLHLEPGECFIGTGLWRPEAETLAKLRNALVENPSGWTKALNHKAFKASAQLRGESLSRPPRGFDPEHPLIEDLKRKDFVAVAYFKEKQTCAPGFMDDFAAECRAASPFMKFLTEAIGLPY